MGTVGRKCALEIRSSPQFLPVLWSQLQHDFVATQSASYCLSRKRSLPPSCGTDKVRRPQYESVSSGLQVVSRACPSDFEPLLKASSWTRPYPFSRALLLPPSVIPKSFEYAHQVLLLYCSEQAMHSATGHLISSSRRPSSETREGPRVLWRCSRIADRASFTAASSVKNLQLPAAAKQESST